MPIVYAIFVALIIFIIWLLTRKKKGVVKRVSQTEYEALYDAALARSPHQMEKLDTRFEKRWDYHCELYGMFRRIGYNELTAKLFTAHASKAQRGWLDPHAGRLFNFNCFGILADPGWRTTKPYFIASPHPEIKTVYWRAYRDTWGSVLDYISLLESSRYVDAYNYATSITTYMSVERAIEFARLLKEGGYYHTAFPEDWGRDLYNIFSNIVSTDVRNHCADA